MITLSCHTLSVQSQMADQPSASALCPGLMMFLGTEANSTMLTWICMLPMWTFLTVNYFICFCSTSPHASLSEILMLWLRICKSSLLLELWVDKIYNHSSKVFGRLVHHVCPRIPLQQSRSRYLLLVKVCKMLLIRSRQKQVWKMSLHVTGFKSWSRRWGSFSMTT